MEQREQEIHLKGDKLNGSFTSFHRSFFCVCSVNHLLDKNTKESNYRNGV